jgi:superfamily II DNA helicase RecQ
LLLVRRKIKENQVATEVYKSIGEEQCICFCLTKERCDDMKNLLTEGGLSCAVFYANMDKEIQQKTVQDFNNGRLQVICATKALGRGVHITCPVKFIIHTTIPTSLTGTSSITIDSTANTS